MSHPSTARLRDVVSKPRYMASWERLKYSRFHLFTQLAAELIGVFFYVYAGVGATAAMVVGDIISQQLGSLFTVGVAYTIGIVLAVTVCAMASGGHFSPSITIAFVVYRGFPPWKAALYILAQILGAYLAFLSVYVQWKDLIVIAEHVLVERGTYDAMMFTPTGPGGIFGLYVLPGANLGRVLYNEFMTDLILGLSICASLDPTNHMIPPAATPWVIGFTYGMAIWGYGPTGIASNTARDLGGRFMAMTIWGVKAAGGPYAAIAALTNIPATLIAFFLYDTLLGSSSRTLTPQHAAFYSAFADYHRTNGITAPGYMPANGPRQDTTSLKSIDEKPVANGAVEFTVANV